MAECVLDASVAVKWLITEDGTEAALRVRDAYQRFHAPDLLVPEVGNILWKKAQRRELTPDEAEIACETMRLAGIQLHAMTAQSAEALRIALALEHPVYDATYLALARSLDIPMITADRRLANKVSATAGLVLPRVELLI